MPYFILLPIFIAWVLIFAVVMAIAQSVPSLIPLRPYVKHVGIWSSIGTLIANVILILLLILGAQAIDGLKDGSSIRASLQVIWGASALIGPFAISALGWFGGASLGLYRAYRRKG